MSATIDIRRNGKEWIIEDGSARIRVTKPGAGIIERFVNQWEEQPDRRDASNVLSAKREQSVRARRR